MLGKAAAEGCPHRKAGHPARCLDDSGGIGAGAEGQTGKTRRLVEIEDQPVQHFDRKAVEPIAAPDSDAKTRVLKNTREFVELAQRSLGAIDRPPAGTGAQTGERGVQIRSVESLD